MMRPLKAIHLIHKMKGAMLKKMEDRKQLFF